MFSQNSKSLFFGLFELPSKNRLMICNLKTCSQPQDKLKTYEPCQNSPSQSCFVVHQMRELILKSISFHLLQDRIYEDRHEYSHHVDLAEITPATKNQFLLISSLMKITSERKNSYPNHCSE